MTTKIFLISYAWSKYEEGNRNESSTNSSNFCFPKEHLGTSVDEKDRVFVLVFCCSRNNLYLTGSFRSVDIGYILMNC